MTNINDVVYVITARGFATLRSNSSVISKQHRTVLTLVDGVCPVAQYVPFLQAFEPLIEKFELLEQIGCLRRVGNVSAVAVKMFDDSVHSGTLVSQLPHIESEHENSGFVPLPGAQEYS
jgi:hypothetical protein